MSEKLIKIFCRDSEEILKIIDTGESLIKFYSKESEICPLIGTDIKEIKLLGKGANGAAFQISFPQGFSGRYVVKLTEIQTTEAKPVKKGMSIADISKETGIDIPILMKFNEITHSPFTAIRRDFILLPFFLTRCKKIDKKFYRVDNGNEIVIKKENAMICEEYGQEFIISTLTGSLYRNGQSINFINTFGTAICKKDDQFLPETEDLFSVDGSDATEYIFMEMIDGVINQLVPKIKSSPDVMDASNRIAIQMLHAILVYQTTFQISHNDLHTDNVFFEDIREDSTWKGKNLVDFDYFVYMVGNVPIYIKNENPRVLVKIGDWGTACKYSDPMILVREIMQNGYGADPMLPLIPNYFCPLYDAYYSCLCLLEYLPIEGSLLHKIVLYVMDLGDKEVDINTPVRDLLRHFEDGGISMSSKYTDRPWPEKLSEGERKNFSLKNALTNKYIMGDYLKEPPKNKTKIVLGYI